MRGRRHPPRPTRASGRNRAEEREQAGVIFVEVLVALLFISVSLLALVPMLVTASRANAAAMELLFATNAAQDKAEELKTVAARTLETGNETLFDGARTYARSWVVADDTPAAGMTAVTVTVTPDREIGNRVRPAVVTFYRTD